MPFSQQHADAACNFFELVLRHTQDEWYGKPFLLMPWQEEAVAQTFGLIDSSGNRIIQMVYEEVPKKAGETEWAAGLALLVLVLSNDPGCQVYGAAAATRQAMNVYRAACKMIEQNPLLRKRLRIMRGTNRIVKRNDPDSFYAAIAAVDGVYRNQDAQLQRDLNQDADSHNSQLNAARYDAEAPFNRIRRLPRRPSSSMAHSGCGCVRGATSSTNVGGGAGFGNGSGTAIRRFSSVPLDAEFRGGSADALMPGHLSCGNPQFVRDRRLSLAIPSPLFEAAFCFFEADGEFFAARHDRPPRRTPGGRTTLTVIRGRFHAGSPKTHI